MLRTGAKIAYAVLVLHVGTEFALRDVFDDLRTYVRTGEGTPRAQAFSNAEFCPRAFKGRTWTREQVCSAWDFGSWAAGYERMSNSAADRIRAERAPRTVHAARPFGNKHAIYFPRGWTE